MKLVHNLYVVMEVRYLLVLELDHLVVTADDLVSLILGRFE